MTAAGHLHREIKITLHKRYNKYFFSIVTGIDVHIFESTHFKTKEECSRGIEELRKLVKLANHIKKLDDGNKYSFAVLSRKKESMGVARIYTVASQRNEAIDVLIGFIANAKIIDKCDKRSQI